MWLTASFFCSALVAAAASDLARRRVPNALTIPLLAAGVVARLAAGGPVSAALGLVGAAVGVLLLAPLFSARWIGGGDVKLVAAIGAWLGPVGALWAAAFGLAGGGFLAGAVAATGGTALRVEVAAHIRTALLVGALAEAPRRTAANVVPVAVTLAGAGIGVFFAQGGL